MHEEIKKYLLSEYEANNQSPVFMNIKDKRIVVPYAYAQDGEVGRDQFISDYFNHKDEAIYSEIEKYKEHNQEALFTKIGKLEFPIPYNDRNLPASQVATNILEKSYKNYEKAVFLTQKANAISGQNNNVIVGKKQIAKLNKFIKENSQTEKASSYLNNRIRQCRNKIVIGAIALGGLLGGASLLKTCKNENKEIKRIENLTQNQIDSISQARFDRLLNSLLGEEGGYATKKTIDQETNFGVTNGTLKGFKKNYKEDAKGFPSTVKNLTRTQASKIIKVAFYDTYKINEINNESMANMLLDICYNHKNQTRREFVKYGLCEVLKKRNLNPEDRPRAWPQVIDFINECSPKEQELLYNTVAQSRVDFLSQPGYIKKYKGLLSRSERFVGEFDAGNTIDWNQAVNLAKVDKGR